jgi:hypothetical protein
LTAIENDVVSLARKLADLRARGYAIEKALEADVTILTAQWDRIKINAQKTMEQQRQLMSTQMGSLQQMLAQLVGQMNNLVAAGLVYADEIGHGLCGPGGAAQSRGGPVRWLPPMIGSLSAHLEWVGWMLDAVASRYIPAAGYRERWRGGGGICPAWPPGRKTGSCSNRSAHLVGKTASGVRIEAGMYPPEGH